MNRENQVDIPQVWQFRLGYAAGVTGYTAYLVRRPTGPGESGLIVTIKPIPGDIVLAIEPGRKGPYVDEAGAPDATKNNQPERKET
jgi:hypothetical protein